MGVGVSTSGATGNASGVRIVVTGDAKTRKSSFIVTVAVENCPTNVPPMVPPTRLPLLIIIPGRFHYESSFSQIQSIANGVRICCRTQMFQGCKGSEILQK
ncbi:unnamed protein product [Fraxinus pennsylvanica]|uniref:Uncharacterized protein n=1 Tax=Fraxinus pennsylvanica TaxID=56036 RepID=A0AAD1ZTV4_9LAMI|nr:unnamed protein product [Fraxinus pennsylvanica]